MRSSKAETGRCVTSIEVPKKPSDVPAHIGVLVLLVSADSKLLELESVGAQPTRIETMFDRGVFDH
jgi:hypothetical protein